MMSAALLKQHTDRVREASDIMAIIREHVGLKRSGSDRYVGLCPFHKEKTASFTVSVAQKRFKCFGCGAGGDVFEFVQRIERIDFRSAKELLASRAGIPLGAMVEEPRRQAGRAEVAGDVREPEKRGDRRLVDTYDYTDEHGEPVYQVLRYEPKSFKQRYPDGGGDWIWKKHANQVLYHLREVLECPIVFLVEGERDVETLRDRGFVATTNAGGANAPWSPQFTEALRGREVILIPDRDPAGYERVERIARALLGNVARLVYLELEDGKDVTEWFARGHSEVELIAQLDGSEVGQ